MEQLCHRRMAVPALGSSDTEDTLLVQKGKVLDENHPLCLLSLGLGQWLWGS